MSKTFLSPSVGGSQPSVSILICFCAKVLSFSSLCAGCQGEILLPGFKRAQLFERGIYIPGPSTGLSKYMRNE